MKLIQRIGYYLGGFSIGLIILAFFLSKKKTSCSYGPEARVLKNINTKKTIYADAINISDSNIIKHVLKHGDVNFSESDTRKKPCGVYLIEGEYKKSEISITVENCDTLVKVLSLKK